MQNKKNKRQNIARVYLYARKYGQERGNKE